MNETEEATIVDGAIEIILEELDDALNVAEEADKRVRGLRTALQDRLIKINQKRYAYDNGVRVFNATLVATAPVVVDLEQLIEDKVLTPDQLDLFTVRKPVVKLLEEAVDAGDIPAGLIARYVRRSEETYSVRVKREQ